jgi:hypothetical protein
MAESLRIGPERDALRVDLPIGSLLANGRSLRIPAGWSRRKAYIAYWAVDVAIGRGRRADNAQTRAERPGRRCQADFAGPRAPRNDGL